MASSARIDELKKKFDENPRRYFAPLANEFRKAGDIDQAIVICEEFLPQQPGHMSGHIVYGQALYEAGRMPESRTVFETALGLDPENLIALRHLGDIARAEGDTAGARTWYMRVLDADPRNDEMQALIATLDGDAPLVIHEEEEATTLAPRVSHLAETKEISIMETLGVEQESSPFEPDMGDTQPAGVPAVPEAIHTDTPSDGIDLLDGFSMSRMEGRAFEDEDVAPASAEGLESTSFSPPEERYEPISGLDDSLDTGVPSFEAPSSAVSHVEGLEQPPAAREEADGMPSLLDVTAEELEIDDGLALPPHGDPVATPSQGHPVAAYEPPVMEAADMHDAAADMPELDDFDMAFDMPGAPEPVSAVADVEAVAPAGELLPVELPPAVIAAEAELLDDSNGRIDEAFELPGAGEAPQYAAEPMPLDDEVPAAPAPFVTETMAELYRAQGFNDRAREVYAQLLEARPGDERLQGLVASLDAAPAGDAGPSVREFFGRLAARRPAGGTAASPPADDDFAAPAEEGTGPVAQVTPAAEPSPHAVAPAIERAAAMRTPGGSIDALFGDRPAATSEDSAASALAQAFGDSADAPPIVGKPAHAAAGELSLDSVFRDGGARPPRTPQSFSFDQFFAGEENAKTVSGPRSSGEVSASDVPAERGAEDIAQFNSWLQGLKPK